MSFLKFFFLVVAVVSIPVIFRFSGKKEIKDSSPPRETPVSSPVSSSRAKEVSPRKPPLVADPAFPSIDRMFQLFTTGNSKLPIVETVEYTSSVPWLKGRPAWLADYAARYGTSRHFISRSLTGSKDYFCQKVAEGQKFNVFKKGINIEFHLLVDVSRLRLALYYVDLDTLERVLLKVYPVGLGRLDPGKPSGTATPLGTYKLGEKVAVYKPGIEGFFQDKKTEMIQVFGSRWIPFGEEIEGCSEPARGYGIHGTPWLVDSSTGALVESGDCIGRYESDGSIRLLGEDMEELFSVVVTKPALIHIVKDFRDITLPGTEVGTPSRQL